MLQSWVSKAPWAQPISRHATKLQQFIVERIPHSHISSSVSSGFGLRMRTGSFKGMQNFPALLVLGRLAKLQFRSTVIELSCCHLFGRISHAWCEIVRQAAPKASCTRTKVRSSRLSSEYDVVGEDSDPGEPHPPAIAESFVAPAELGAVSSSY